MKNNISNKFIKIAGVKNIEDFYAKYPTEEAFFKAHPEAKKHIKKAQTGLDVNKNGIPDYLEGIQPIQGPQNKITLPKAPIAEEEPIAPNLGIPAYKKSQEEIIAENNAITQATPQEFAPLNKVSFADKAAPYIGAASDVIKGITSLGAQKEEKRRMRQMRKVTDLQKIASGTREEEPERRYVTPWDNPVQPDQMFPTYGVGTNVLAKDGKIIKKAQVGFTEGMGMESEYDDIQPIIDEYENVPGGMMGREKMIPEVDATVPVKQENKKIDSNSARDTWVEKTGMPWSEAKRLGYTDGSAKDNIKLLNELKDPRFKKENIRTAPPKKSSQSRTPVQHRETPTGRLAPIKKPQTTIAEYFKNKPKYNAPKSNIQVPDEGTMLTRATERLANPLQTLGYYSKYRELPPEGFSKNDKNAYDQVIGMANPTYWLNALGNAYDYAVEGEYKKAGMEALDALPAAAGKLKYTKYIPYKPGLPPAREFIRRAGYLGEGAKRLKPAPPKQLGQGYVPNFVMYQQGGEIQNTYAPGYLYDNLGYEPLNDSDDVKQYYYGGDIPEAESGFSTMLNNSGFGKFMGSEGGGQALGMISGALSNNSGESQIGKGLGTAAGTIFGGPVGGMIGGALGSAVGGLFNTSQRSIKRDRRAIKRNMDTIMGNQLGQNLQNQYSGYMEEGGQITNPQLITRFGELDEQDFYNYAHEGMDTLRAGGHLRSYTPISERGMQTYAMGGELKTHWGGYAETMSQNPYLPGNGETVMFRGKSHDESDGYGNTGIGITYGNSPVEVERGEPAVKLKDGSSGEENLTVYGNLKIPNEYIPLLGDDRAKGKKFKNYIAEISKDEARQNKLVDKSTDKLNNLDVRNSFDKLKMASLQANIQGANMKLKSIADKKINAANLQNAINDTAEEYGLDADSLARGKGKISKEALQEYAEYGKKIKKAQNGTSEYGLVPWEGNKYGLGKRTASEFTTKEWDEVAKKYGFKGKGNAEFQKFLMSHPEASQIIKTRHNLLYGKNPETDAKLYDNLLGAGWAAPELLKLPPAATVPAKDKSSKTEKEKEDKRYATTPYKRSLVMDIANQILPFIRPTDQEPLDPNQLMGELYALSTNQLEPVQAQGYRKEEPDLGTPYDISLQDQLNANQADFNSMQRMVGYNPAAQSMLAAQKYAANTGVLGEQFRMNQAMRAGVYDKNRDILNDAKLKNLAIYDQQYERQAQAKSNTKAVTQAALNSIADKYAKNRLENRTLGIYENMYNYRFDPAGRAINMNPLYQPNIPTLYPNQKDPNMIPVTDANGNIIQYVSTDSTESESDYTPLEETQKNVNDQTATKRKGGNIRKNYSQSSIVKAFK